MCVSLGELQFMRPEHPRDLQLMGVPPGPYLEVLAFLLRLNLLLNNNDSNILVM